MGANLGTLTLDLVAKIGSFTGPLDKAGRESKKRMSEIEKSARSASIAIGSMVSVGAITAFTGELIKTSLEMQKMERLFNAAAGSANLGGRELEYVKNVADKLGLTIASTANDYGKFMAAIRGTSIEGEAGRKVFESVSMAATALGLSADETHGMFNALQQMMSKGKVQAEELRGQLGERLPGALQLAARAMGVTSAELNKMMEDGKLFASDLLPKLAIELDKTYGQAATEGAKSAQAEINRFNNAMLESKDAAGKALLPVFTDIVNMATPAILSLQKITQAVQIFGVRLAANSQKRSTFWDNLFSGRGVFSEEGLKRQAAAAAAADKLAEEQIAEILGGKNTNTAYTQQEKARQAANAETERKAAAAAAAIERQKKASAAAAKEQREHEKALRALNTQLEKENKLLEESVEGWDLTPLGKGLLDNPLQAPKVKMPKFSVFGASEDILYSKPSTLDPDAAKEMLGGMKDAPSFGGLDAEVGGAFGELAKIDSAEEKLAEWYNTQLEMLENFRSERADLNAEWDAAEQDLDKRHQDELLKIEQAKQSAQLQAASSVFDNLAGMTESFAGRQSIAYRAMFAVSKAFAIADSIVQIANGIAKAANNPWPANLAAMASVAAATMGIVSSIQSVAMVGQAHDGIMSVPESGTWNLKKGERVTTAETSAKLDRTLDTVQKSQNGNGGAPIVNLYEDKSKAGTVNSRQENGRNMIDIFVADLMGDGRVQKAMSRKFGLQPVGA